VTTKTPRVTIKTASVLNDTQIDEIHALREQALGDGRWYLVYQKLYEFITITDVLGFEHNHPLVPHQTWLWLRGAQ